MQLQLSCLFVLLTLLSFGHAQPPLIKWGELVKHVPTAVSHPLLTPAVRTFVLPLPATYVHNHAPSTWTALSSFNSYGNGNSHLHLYRF
ncbi:hypothetical protein ACLKA6_004972 [Drosophila palustris]